MNKGTILEHILVEKLVFGGAGFSRLKSDNKDINGKAIFISGSVIPGSIVNVRVLKSKKDFIEGQCLEIIKKSPIEQKNPDNIYPKQAGCMWVDIPYEEQLKIKAGQIDESFFHLKKLQAYLNIKPIIESPLINSYRNKIEFSFGKYISNKENKGEHFNVGFHKQGEFSKIEDFDGTILISDLANKIYKEIKDFAKNSSFPVYDQFDQKGFFRHIILRQAFFTNQIMIIFGVNHKFEGIKNFLFITDFFLELVKKYSEIKSIYLSLNDNKADIAIGELKLIYGKESITEKICNLFFEISPKSFFQTNSYGAQKLYGEILNQINLDELKDYTILDLYAGTGTIGMIFAKYVKKVISVELSSSASQDGEKNAKLNNLENIEFVNKKVEDYLDDIKDKNGNLSIKADLLIIDPPRAGMHPDALPNILKFKTRNIIYVSCNPSTLVRDLEFVLKNSNYKIESVTPVDMFPHTHHIETIVNLVRI